ncbi:META domain-containing protein [Nocardia uniformis]|uniref:META domain-containing protein n=1 Tax=Nocardia uniformis TaxID=53432 RepID=A0A849CEN2_9NOCA|nr:META domain-containing protein [Nocardia uniformis]NNH75140.1 META domain-containing protein [Nocardia uniformis]
MPATRVWGGFVLALTAAVVAGCSSSGDDTAPTPTPMGRAFVSTEVEGRPIPGGGPMNLSFAEDRVSANSGCNTATGPVNLEGHVLTVDQLAATLMGCPDERGAADEWQDGLLRSRPSWTLDGDTLTLSGNDSTVTLLDRKVAHPDKPLVGTNWIVTAVITNDAEVRSQTLEEVRPTLLIGSDGAVSGTAGCNRIMGSAEVIGTDATFQIGTTKMMCDPQVMEVEQQVLTTLSGKTTGTIDSDTLTLRNTENGTGLKLRAE